MNLEVSRRQFLRVLGIASGALAANACGSPSGFTSDTSEPRLPSNLQGIVPNCLNLPYQDSDVRKRLIENINRCEATVARVFLDDRLEEEGLGKYQTKYLDQIGQAAGEVGITLDLFDGFAPLHQTKPESKYLIDKDKRNLFEQQMAIFTDEEVLGHLENRIRFIVSRLKNESGIQAWGVANELVLNKAEHSILAISKGQSLRAIHTPFYKRMVEAILSIDSSRPILLGVDDPNAIDESAFASYRHIVFNTIHVYPTPAHEKIIKRYTASNNHVLGLLGQEIGLSRKYLYESGMVPSEEVYDETLTNFLEGQFAIIEPHIQSLGPWRVTADGDSHSDGYEIDPRKLSKTQAFLGEAKASLLSNNVVSSPVSPR